MVALSVLGKDSFGKCGKLGMGATDQKPLNGRLSTGLFARTGGERRSITRIAKGGVGIDSRGTAAVDGSCLPLLPVLFSYANQTSDCGRGNVLSPLGLGNAA